MKQQRNSNIEALRVLLMLLIILLHMSGEFYDIKELRLKHDDIISSSILSLRMIFLLGVNTFAFTSGYFGIKTPPGQIGRKLVKYELLALSWGGDNNSLRYRYQWNQCTAYLAVVASYIIWGVLVFFCIYDVVGSFSTTQ